MAPSAGTQRDRFYRQLCEHAGIALIGTDADYRIQTWNAAAVRMFGASAELMIGMPAVSAVPQDKRAQAQQLIERAARDGETGELEFEYRDAQGGRRELSGTIAPILDDAGTAIGAVVCVRDITKRVRLIEQLHESRKMGALGEMAGAIAHHFNNILGGIITSVDFADASESPLTKSRILGQVSRSLTRATSLVGALLAFAEGDQRGEDLSDFTEIVNGLADQFEPTLRRVGIELVMDLPALAVVAVPRLQVTTILRNIIQNAVDVMPEGGTLTISGTRRDDKIVARICDTGCGLDESSLLRIFEPFWSTKGAVNRGDDTQALGLGLAVAHGLVHMIGGTIEVTSEVNQGSCFEITVPAHASLPSSNPPDA